MATPRRDWPNVCANVRDGIAEIIRKDISNLEKIIQNEVNDEEAIEALVARVTSDLNLLLRCLEKVGAGTSPINELENRILQLKTSMSFTAARA